MRAIFQLFWLLKLIGKLGVPYNRRLRVRGSPHPNGYDVGLSPAATESNAFHNQFKFFFFAPSASSRLCVKFFVHRLGGKRSLRLQNVELLSAGIYRVGNDCGKIIGAACGDGICAQRRPLVQGQGEIRAV